ncbi:hypothetical protein I7N42_03810, partial [Neisseria meningitidis]|nr:hypothetical protein [Neisseria meningitidis]
ALFGVYGFLALGFVLLVARYLKPNAQFDDKLMTWGFWLLNGGDVPFGLSRVENPVFGGGFRRIAR